LPKSVKNCTAFRRFMNKIRPKNLKILRGLFFENQPNHRLFINRLLTNTRCFLIINRPKMKNNYAFGILLFLLSVGCKHEPITPDAEYLDQAANTKVTEFSNGYLPSSHGTIGISSGRDTLGKDRLYLAFHINYNHTLDAFKVTTSDWLTLPNHFGNNSVIHSVSSDNDQLVAFQIRSKTPQNELTSGEVLVPRQTPITATDLGNNTFKITWLGLNRKQRVLINLYTEYAYTQPYYTGNFAVETDDDGVFILKPEVFEKFGKNSNPFNAQGPIERMRVTLYRHNPKAKTVVTQASTGAQYEVFGGFAESALIEVMKK
jgi:hypothetical protein